jgi:hypothetical protein
VAALREVSEAERLTGARGVVRTVAAKGRLRDGLTEEAAADVLWLLMAPDHYRRLTRARGSSHARFARWYADTMVALLLP